MKYKQLQFAKSVRLRPEEAEWLSSMSAKFRRPESEIMRVGLWLAHGHEEGLDALLYTQKFADLLAVERDVTLGERLEMQAPMA